LGSKILEREKSADLKWGLIPGHPQPRPGKVRKLTRSPDLAKSGLWMGGRLILQTLGSKSAKQTRPVGVEMEYGSVKVIWRRGGSGMENDECGEEWAMGLT